MENVKGLNLGLMKVTNKGGIEMNYLIITTLIATNIYSYFMYKKERRLVEEVKELKRIIADLTVELKKSEYVLGGEDL